MLILRDFYMKKLQIIFIALSFYAVVIKASESQSLKNDLENIETYDPADVADWQKFRNEVVQDFRRL
jgi:hypothetical protein